MIYEVLSEIKDRLNQHFRLRFGLPEDKLFLSGLVDAGGAAAIDNDLVVMMPINIQEEKHVYNRRNTNEPPFISLNVLVLITTTFSGKNAAEGLKFLTETVSFFMQNNAMDIEGNRIAIEYYNLDLQLQNNLWASLGAKYAPSVIYRISLIRIEEGMASLDINLASNFPTT
ncbi:MAG TPA: hypothetical protein DCQ31_04105 [Bacteroidales bacterium]|nr:hypothetical protein [Bacteroidales bacterium]